MNCYECAGIYDTWLLSTAHTCVVTNTPFTINNDVIGALNKENEHVFVLSCRFYKSKHKKQYIPMYIFLLLHNHGKGSIECLAPRPWLFCIIKQSYMLSCFACPASISSLPLPLPHSLPPSLPPALPPSLPPSLPSVLP